MRLQPLFFGAVVFAVGCGGADADTDAPESTSEAENASATQRDTQTYGPCSINTHVWREGYQAYSSAKMWCSPGIGFNFYVEFWEDTHKHGWIREAVSPTMNGSGDTSKFETPGLGCFSAGSKSDARWWKARVHYKYWDSAGAATAGWIADVSKLLYCVF